MSTLLAKVFTPLTEAPVEVLAELSQILYQSYFCIVGDFGKEEQILLAITHNYLYVSQVFSSLFRPLRVRKLVFFAPLVLILNFRCFVDNGLMIRPLVCL